MWLESSVPMARATSSLWSGPLGDWHRLGGPLLPAQWWPESRVSPSSSPPRPAATRRHTDQVDTGHHFEQFAVNVGSAADAGVRYVDLARIGPGIGDELG